MSWRPMAVGQRATRTTVFTAADVEAYAALTGDRNPIHFDAGYASGTPFGHVIVHGGLTTGLFSALIAAELPGPGSVLLRQTWEYLAPVRIGETISAEVEVLESRVDKPISRVLCTARRADGTEVLRGDSLVFRMQPDASLEGV